MKYLDEFFQVFIFMIVIFCFSGIGFVKVIMPLITGEIDNKHRIIAKTISAEACSEGAQGMMGVASTIKNRMDQRLLTAYEVVTEPNQYYGLTHPNRNKIFKDSRCADPAMWFAKSLDELPDIVDGAIFFKTPEEKRQVWHKELTVIIGRLEFYK